MAPAAPQFPTGTSSRLDADLGHSHPSLLSAAQETLPCTMARRCCVSLVPARSVLHCPCAHVDEGRSRLGLPQAGGSRFAKGLSLVKRHKFLGMEAETAAQTVPLPGMSGWSHCKPREITAPSQLGNHYLSFWRERQLRYYHRTSGTIYLLQKDQEK